MAADLGAPLAKRLILDVPVLNVERELVVRLEDQNRATNENDLRDMRPSPRFSRWSTCSSPRSRS